jgi:hypothetical protein
VIPILPITPQQPNDDLPPELLATARHVELSRPESEAEWFPKLPLIGCTLFIAACVVLPPQLVLLNVRVASFLALTIYILSYLASAIGQGLLIPIAVLSLLRHAPLRSFENLAVLLVSEAVYFYMLVDAAGSSVFSGFR